MENRAEYGRSGGVAYGFESAAVYPTTEATKLSATSLVGSMEQTSINAAKIASRATAIAGKLVGYFPPESAGGPQAPEPADSAARLRCSQVRIENGLSDILAALNAIEERLS